MLFNRATKVLSKSAKGSDTGLTGFSAATFGSHDSLALDHKAES